MQNLIKNTLKKQASLLLNRMGKTTSARLASQPLVELTSIEIKGVNEAKFKRSVVRKSATNKKKADSKKKKQLVSQLRSYVPSVRSDQISVSSPRAFNEWSSGEDTTTSSYNQRLSACLVDVEGKSKGLRRSTNVAVSSSESAFINSHHYADIFGYRHNKAILNPNITFQGIRRVLHYLKNVVDDLSLPLRDSQEKKELIIVLDSNASVPSSSGSIGSNSRSPKTGGDSANRASQRTSTILFAYSILRLTKIGEQPALANLQITLKTTKDVISYLSAEEKGATRPCGVIMINPAKSALCTLADRIFGSARASNDRNRYATNSLGYLCAKKGIPLISLCDIASSVTYATYPILCDTRDIKSFYLVLDILSYGINQLNPKD